MNSAFATREAPNETLQQVERRIHDGAAENQLHERAQTYVNEMFALFPWLTVSPDGVTVEGGPGVGYISSRARESHLGCLEQRSPLPASGVRRNRGRGRA